jgi:Ser/Thr protein kinase RdoA (MazF antagonist)
MPAAVASTDATSDFAQLSPERVLDVLEAAGLRPDGRLSALNSFENRVFLAHLDEPFLGPEGAGAPFQSVVLKCYRPHRWSDAQIAEEHAFALELAAADVPVVPPLALGSPAAATAVPTMLLHQGLRCAVSRAKGGRTPELDQPEVLEWIGRFLGRLHTVGARQPFAHRPAISLQRLGHAARSALLAPAAAHGVAPECRSEWADISAQCLEAVATSGLAQARTLRTHGDCHPGNILWTPGDPETRRECGPHFVDLDDCAMAPAVQDLWMLLSGERADAQAQLGALLDGYEQWRDFDRAELALIEPLRTLRLIHYSAWLAQRWSEPVFQRSFGFFGSAAYWADQVVQLREQLEAMQRAPLVA